MGCLVNLKEAVDLLDVISNFKFKVSETPKFCIYDQGKEGHTLWIKADLISQEYRNFLEKIVESGKLGIRKSNEYIVIFGREVS